MSSVKIPVYAPIKGFDYDRSKIKTEMEDILMPLSKERSVVFREGKSVYDTSINLDIADSEKLNQTTFYKENAAGEREVVPGQYSTYHVLNLTRIPGEPDTEWLTYTERRGLRVNYWHLYKEPWTWMEELDGSYLKSVIESLPFEYVQTVRMVSMKPPAIGQVHIDSHMRFNQKWLDDGFASVTLNISSGNSVLKFSVGEKVFVSDPEEPVSHFNDAYHHGVPEITEPRHQLRIFGKMDSETYLKMMNLDLAVWPVQ